MNEYAFRLSPLVSLWRIYAWVIGVIVAVGVVATVFEGRPAPVLLSWAGIAAIVAWRYLRYRRLGVDARGVLGPDALEIHAAPLLERRIPWTEITSYEAYFHDAVSVQVNLADGSRLVMACAPMHGDTARLGEFFRALDAHVKTLDLPDHARPERHLGVFGSRGMYWVCVALSVAAVAGLAWGFAAGFTADERLRLAVWSGFLVATFWGVYLGARK